jgi:AcrR family transcriptional regulator
MSRPSGPVKKVRAYDATLRRERARQTQERIVRIAEEQFLAHGYVTTSVAAVARAAEVSVDTIYKSFGGKPGLVRAIWHRALQGEGPVPAEQRSDRLQAEEPDPRRIIAGWGQFVAELAPRWTPMALLVRTAAATDPELSELLDELDAGRLRRMTDNARRLHEAGHLRPGVTIAQAADVLWTYSSHELYELLVIRRRMPVGQYADFVAEAMTAALL